MALQSDSEIKTVSMPAAPDFSLVLGGPLFQLFQRTHLCGEGLERLRRRILAIATFTWLPLLLLSVIEGHALGGSLNISFLRDIEAHVRFLIDCRLSLEPNWSCTFVLVR